MTAHASAGGVGTRTAEQWRDRTGRGAVSGKASTTCTRPPQLGGGWHTRAIIRALKGCAIWAELWPLEARCNEGRGAARRVAGRSRSGELRGMCDRTLGTRVQEAAATMGRECNTTLQRGWRLNTTLTRGWRLGSKMRGRLGPRAPLGGSRDRVTAREAERRRGKRRARVQ